MGDVRFVPPFRRVRDAPDPTRATSTLADDEVVQALAAASRENDPYLANVLASEAMNRMRRARTVFQHLGEGVVLLGPAGDIQALNPAAQALLGLDDAAEGLPHERLHADESHCCVCQAMRDQDVASCEDDRLRTSSGREVPVSCVAAPIVRDGAVDGYVLAFRDISERAAWTALVEAFYHLHDELGLGLVVVGDGRIEYANDAFRALVGLSLEPLRALTNLLDLAAPEDRVRLADAFAAPVPGRPVGPVRAKLLDARGIPAEVDLHVTATASRGSMRLVVLVQPVRPTRRS